jgi:hypothetical protein
MHSAAPEAGTSGTARSSTGNAATIAHRALTPPTDTTTVDTGIAVVPVAATATSTATATRTALPAGMRRAADVLHEIIWRLLLAREQHQGASQ